MSLGVSRRTEFVRYAVYIVPKEKYPPLDTPKEKKWLEKPERILEAKKVTLLARIAGAA